MAISEETLQKRNKLKELSDKVLLMAIDANIDTTLITVNMLLMLFEYNPKNEYEFNSFNSWKKKGYSVQKGEKAYLLWGQPVSRHKAEQSEIIADDSEVEQGKKDFYPLAYIFRNDQVKKIEGIKERKQKKPEPEPEEIENDLLPF